MTQLGDDPGLPDDVLAMIREMCDDRTCRYWALTRQQVYTFAQSYGRRHATYLDDADDLTNDVMEILATPGKLEAFGQRVPPGAEPQVVQRMYRAWLHTITHRVWTTRLRYYQARVTLVQVTTRVADIEQEATLDPADPFADVPGQVESRALVRALFARLQGLAGQGSERAAQVTRFLRAALDGVPYKVLAERFNLKPSQVRDEIAALRRYLREKLRDHWDDATDDRGPGSLAKRPKKPRRPGGPKHARPPAEAVPAAVSTEPTTSSKGA